MSALQNHVILMFLYSVATALFFSLLWKPRGRERNRFFVVLFLSLFAGGLALAWIMAPFPIR